MTSHFEKFLETIEQKLPQTELLTCGDLSNAGLCSQATFVRLRKQHLGPEFIRFPSSRQFRYLRSSVIEWLRKTHDRSVSEKANAITASKGVSQ